MGPKGKGDVVGKTKKSEKKSKEPKGGYGQRVVAVLTTVVTHVDLWNEEDEVFDSEAEVVEACRHDAHCPTGVDVSVSSVTLGAVDPRESPAVAKARVN